MSFHNSMPQFGERLVAIGSPVFSLPQTQDVTDGSISSPFGMGGDTLHFQLTAPIQPRSSGGPVLDSHGRQTAVVVQKPSQQIHSRHNVENVS